MNTIKNYLENMFLGLPQTEDVIKAKNELLAMMEDKYNELKNNGKTENEAIGIVISEFGNLDELADVLGIKDIIKDKTDFPLVSHDEAKQYIENSKLIAPKTALGVFLCITAPIILLLVLGFSEMFFINVKEELLVAIGLVALICMVATGVSYFIRFSSKLEKYEYLRNDIFELDYNTEQMVRSIQEQDEQNYKSAVNISVICYILSALPVITIPLISENEGLSIISVVITLIIVAFATYNLISKSAVHETCNILLQQGDYSKKSKLNTVQKTITSVYWIVIVAVYLGYSFITNNWAMSWIIWPVAGVLFGAIRVGTDGFAK